MMLMRKALGAGTWLAALVSVMQTLIYLCSSGTLSFHPFLERVAVVL